MFCTSHGPSSDIRICLNGEIALAAPKAFVSLVLRVASGLGYMLVVAWVKITIIHQSWTGKKRLQVRSQLVLKCRVSSVFQSCL